MHTATCRNRLIHVSSTSSPSYPPQNSFLNSSPPIAFSHIYAVVVFTLIALAFSHCFRCNFHFFLSFLLRRLLWFSLPPVACVYLTSISIQPSSLASGSDCVSRFVGALMSLKTLKCRSTPHFLRSPPITTSRVIIMPDGRTVVSGNDLSTVLPRSYRNRQR